jgi:hypothetical protein
MPNRLSRSYSIRSSLLRKSKNSGKTLMSTKGRRKRGAATSRSRDVLRVRPLASASGWGSPRISRTSRISGKLDQKWKVASISYFGICGSFDSSYPPRSRALWLVDEKRSLKINCSLLIVRWPKVAFIDPVCTRFV